MKRTLKFYIPIITIFLGVVLMGATAPQKRIKILFFGDSITEKGMEKGGYIDLLQHTIDSLRQRNRYQLKGAGVGGNKVYDLYLRLEDDVLLQKPDVVFIYVGINDVWQKQNGVGTDIGKYEKFYAAILKKLRSQHIKVILCTPTLIGEKTNGTNTQDSDLDAYAQVVRALSKTNNYPLVDLRKVFIAYENTNNTANADRGILTYDTVHMTDKGNRLIAQQIYEILKTF